MRSHTPRILASTKTDPGLEALERRRGRDRPREIGSVIVCGVHLLVDSRVVEICCHRGDECLFLGAGELNNRYRGKYAQDDEDNQNLDQRKPMRLSAGMGRDRGGRPAGYAAVHARKYSF